MKPSFILNVIAIIVVLFTGCATPINDTKPAGPIAAPAETIEDRIKKTDEKRATGCAKYLADHPDLPDVDKRALAPPTRPIVGIQKATAHVILSYRSRKVTHFVLGSTETETWQIDDTDFYHFTNDILTGWSK